MNPVDRPLRLGEVLARTAELYEQRFWAALGLGAVVGGSYGIATAIPPLVGLAGFALVLTACYGAAVRLACGDPFGEAWAQVALRLPVLLVLALVVSVPLALAVDQAVILLLVVAWLGLVGFSIPVAMLERNPDSDSWFGRLGYSLTRSVALARAEYLHAVGVAAALAIVYVVIGGVLARALVGFADNAPEVAFGLAQLVLAPFFFLGLTVLYFDQKARALSSRPDK